LLAELQRLKAVRRAQLEQEQQEKLARWPVPGALAVALDPSIVQTPALDLIDNAIVWAYETPGARLAISMPPQEGKSERVTRTGTLWALIRNPEMRAGIASYAQSLAEGFGRDIRNRIQANNGDEGTLDLGLKVAEDYGSAKRWQLEGHRGGVVCVGIGSGLTGRPLDVLVVDDPFADAEQAASQYYRDRVWDWFRSVGLPRLAPGAPVIVILTRWHENDLVGRLLEAEDAGRWRVINIPALADHDPAKGQTDPLGRAPGEWLVSARGRTAEQWEQIRIQAGVRVFTSLYQGRPSPEQGNVWLRHWWRRYHEPLWSQHPSVPGAYLAVGMEQVIMSWDMAFKNTRSSDFVVGGVLGRRGADVFLLDMVHKRLSFTDTLVAFGSMVARWPQAAAKLVEDKANGTAVISALQSKIPGIVPVNPTDSKYGRATSVAPFIEAGNVHLPSPEVGLFDPAELIEEAAGFPNAAHDDMVDMMSQGLAELLLDGTGAGAWIAWARKKAAETAAAAAAAAETVTVPPMPEPRLEPAGLLEQTVTAAAIEAAAGYNRCGKPDCDRTVKPGVLFCCAPCAQAADGGYEIHAHSDGCDRRAGERGTALPANPAAARRAARTAALLAAGWN
jgi:predicted phage terminase large subunit-like protein